VAGGTTVELAGREVAISSPDKVFFPDLGATKLDVVRYYEAVEEPLLAAMGDRPLLLERHPDGAGGSSFFQKRIPKNAPDWLTTTTVQTVNGTPSQVLVAADLAHVAWAVNLGCIGFHVWPVHAGDVEVADELRIDLDPSPGTDFDDVRWAAARTRELFDELGVRSFPKTTGKSGIHVYVRLTPEQDAYAVRAAAVAVARELERRHPERITAAWWKEERGARVFVDYNQNAPHKSLFGAWCVRATAGATVSTPFDWDELDEVDPAAMTIETVPARLERDGDPWAAMYEAPASLAPLTAMHEADMAAGLMDAPWPPVYPKMPNEPPRVAPSRAADHGDD
jgi:DNA ligase D